ncbi:Uma2 family endonuclease [bacterium]|nr:Uma2 family endonuclease [bacterium]
MSTPASAATPLVYPDSDGQPTADNTLQWDWMVKIVGELRELLAGQQVFVAGDLLWYPTEGNLDRQAPDTLVAFCRPPGYRGSYKQWEEGGVAPQVVFEVLSPSNTQDEMRRKLRWYEKHGVEEYYLIDPYMSRAYGWVRDDTGLAGVAPFDEFVSPRLGIRFVRDDELRLFTPDGRKFRTREDRIREIVEELEGTAEELRKTTLAFGEERERAAEARREADEAAAKLERERAAKEQLRVKLRAAGIDPDAA